jgi:hypothetical protein
MAAGAEAATAGMGSDATAATGDLAAPRSLTTQISTTTIGMPGSTTASPTRLSMTLDGAATASIRLMAHRFGMPLWSEASCRSLLGARAWHSATADQLPCRSASLLGINAFSPTSSPWPRNAYRSPSNSKEWRTSSKGLSVPGQRSVPGSSVGKAYRPRIRVFRDPALPIAQTSLRPKPEWGRVSRGSGQMVRWAALPLTVAVGSVSAAVHPRTQA